MKKAKNQINDIYNRYRDNRVITDPRENKRLGLTGFIDNTIKQLSTEFDGVLSENAHRLTNGEVDELNAYGNTLLESFSKIAKNRE
ncbi:hypothetical protein ACX0HA_14000 [Flavobacterium hauense]